MTHDSFLQGQHSAAGEPDALAIAFSTCPDRDCAERIAQVLVQERLAACVQIDGPIHSTYSWQGRVETASEWRLWIKGTGSSLEAARRRLAALHPYEIPQWLTLSVAAGTEYQHWVRGCVA